MRKLKVVLIVLLTGWLIIYGVPSYRNIAKTFNVYKTDLEQAKSVQSEISVLKQDIKSLNDQITQLRGSSVDLNDKVEVTEAIDAIAKLESIDAKRLNGAGDSVVVASINDKSGVINFNSEVNEIQYTINTRDYNKVLASLEKLKLNYESVSIIPEKHQLKLNVLFTGGGNFE